MHSEPKTYIHKGDQGDLRFTVVPESSVPNEAIRSIAGRGEDGSSVFIVGHSESGHHHIVDATEAVLYETPDPFIAYLRLADGDAIITHQKTGEHVHGPVTLKNPGPGNVWRVSRQREYFPEGLRRAAD